MKKISCVVLCLAMLAEMLCFSVYADESGSDQNSNLTRLFGYWIGLELLKFQATEIFQPKKRLQGRSLPSMPRK